MSDSKLRQKQIAAFGEVRLPEQAQDAQEALATNCDTAQANPAILPLPVGL